MFRHVAYRVLSLVVHFALAKQLFPVAHGLVAILGPHLLQVGLQLPLVGFQVVNDLLGYLCLPSLVGISTVVARCSPQARLVLQLYHHHRMVFVGILDVLQECLVSLRISFQHLTSIHRDVFHLLSFVIHCMRIFLRISLHPSRRIGHHRVLESAKPQESNFHIPLAGFSYYGIHQSKVVLPLNRLHQFPTGSSNHRIEVHLL